MNKIITLDTSKITNNGGRVFVISDLHGNINAFNAFLNAVHFSTIDYCICLGDCIDRGEHGIKILQYIMKHPKNFILLMGNHEDIFLNALDEVDNDIQNGMWLATCLKNGGETTLEEFLNLSCEEQDELVNWLRERPYVCIVNRTTFLVHAGLTQNWLNELAQGIVSTNEYNCPNVLWARDAYWNMANDIRFNGANALIIAGHTHSHNFGGTYGEVLYNSTNNRLILDCTTAATNKVGYVVFTNDSMSWTSV